VETASTVHEQVLAAHDGATGIRLRELLESAVTALRAAKMGVSLIAEPIEIAAAYLFYLCGDHPFVDGTLSPPVWFFSVKTGCCPMKRRIRMHGKTSPSSSRRAYLSRADITAKLRKRFC
jgi:hypothetical protein